MRAFVRQSVSLRNKTCYTSTARSFEEIPGPKGTDEFFGAGGFQRVDKVQKLFKEKYGDVVVQDFFGKKFVYIFHPDDIQKVFHNEGKYPRGIVEILWFTSEFRRKYYGDKAVEFSSGEAWRNWRSKVQKDIFSPKDAASYLTLMEKSVEEATDVFPQWASGNNHNLFYSVASFDLLQYILFNKGINIWKGDFDTNPFKKVVVAALTAFSLMSRLGTYTKENVPKDLYQTYVDSMTTTHDFLSVRVNDILTSKDFNPENTAFGSYFHKLIERGEFDKTYYIQHGASLLFAALDTTASNIMWFIYNLAKSPQVQEKLYEEVKSVLGDGPLKIEHLTKIPYMKACLKENFRLSPVVPNLNRIIPEELELGGYKIPANSIVNMSPFFTYCQDEKIFKNPEEFIPERWGKDKKEQRTESLHDHPFMVIPFSFGPRMCLGARVAELETMSFIARLLQKYKISVDPKSPPSKLYFVATSKPDPLPKYIIEKRS